ncbi:alpha-glucosidase C-terminal domain-containing protein [Sporolactobacillus caesalpiniae]|uniref:alpha-glucosidase C-terminal domain-containing protein n=1 Tax=Sporolactobacillus caesalpiniae TaxID=3230362 RepID=UPI00404734D1
MIHLRKNSQALIHGDYTLLEPNHEKVWAFTRTYGQEELLMILNFSNQQTDFAAPEQLLPITDKKIMLSNVPKRLPDTNDGIRLHPYEARVYLVK